MHRDPVCGKKMNPNKAHVKVRYAGADYYLCCPRCQSEFEAAPKRYVDQAGKRAAPGQRRGPSGER